MQYYGTRLSENISRREPEGYLLCLNVPVARTGTQEYLPEELGLPPAAGISLRSPERSPCHPERSPCHPERSEGSSPRLISVYRPESEVFAPETVASFEGMPVTDNHPPDGVDIRNIRRLQMGHAHNVRRGTGGESDLLLADLIITDPRLIGEILSGKREISCGYNYELHEENGQYIQRKIRGNHIAVVDAGRAGKRVSIRDARARDRPCPCHPEQRAGSSFILTDRTSERRKPTMKKSLIRTLARLAKDGDAETVAEFIEAMAGETAETAEAPETQETPAEETVTVEVPENHEITIDGDAFSALLQRLDSLIALLSAGLTPAEPAADDDPVEEIVEEVLEAAKSEGKTAAEAEGEALTTVSGGNLVRAEVNRNMQSPRCGAETIEAAVAEMMESAAEPAVSVTIEQKEEDCGGPDSAAAKDALRAVLKTFRPVLAQMSPKERRRACAELAANLRSGGRANDTGVYASLASARKAPANLNDLGRRIMAARNPNYHK